MLVHTGVPAIKEWFLIQAEYFFNEGYIIRLQNLLVNCSKG